MSEGSQSSSHGEYPPLRRRSSAGIQGSDECSLKRSGATVSQCYGFIRRGQQTLLVCLEEEDVDGTVQCLRVDLLEPVDLEVGVDAVVDVVAELVRPVDKDTGARLRQRRVNDIVDGTSLCIACSPCGTRRGDRRASRGES